MELRDSDLETAVELLGQVLEVRNKAYGTEAPECADTYLYYGQCLFEQAQVGVRAAGTTPAARSLPASGNSSSGCDSS
jgi:hypothetical protein